jgi:hypothetical protein
VAQPRKLGHRREELVQGVGKGKLKALSDEAKAWRDVWSAGHGVATIHDAAGARAVRPARGGIPRGLRPAAEPGRWLRLPAARRSGRGWPRLAVVHALSALVQQAVRVLPSSG